MFSFKLLSIVYSALISAHLTTSLVSPAATQTGISTQECGMFYGPVSGQKAKFCANTGRILYRCEEYNQGRQIVLQNCQKYTNPLNLQSSLEPNAVPQVFCGAYMTHYPNGGVAYTDCIKQDTLERYRCGPPARTLITAGRCTIVEGLQVDLEMYGGPAIGASQGPGPAQ